MINFLFSLVALLVLSASQARQTEYTDYIIVGAGTSGCIIASKLCQAFPNRYITLLERGPNRNKDDEFVIRAPRKLYDSWSNRRVTEGYPALPDEDINGRTTVVLAGNTLGGTSSIAGVQWTTPLPGSAEKLGIKGLTTDTAYPYYKQVFDDMSFAPPKFPLQYADDYVKVARGLGYSAVSDPILKPLRYVWQNRLAINSQFRRENTCSKFVDPVLVSSCRHNLKIVTNETASQILFRKRRNIQNAYGIETTNSADKVRKRRFIARHEIILSAGPYGSPQLLQLSGVGSPTTLKSAGIPVKIPLPVGEATISRASCNVKSTYNGVPDEPANNLTFVNSPKQRKLWNSGKGGILATPVTAVNGRTGDNAYFAAFLIPFMPGSPELRTSCQHNTQNAGYVRIRDKNPFSKPLVKFNLLKNQTDLGRLSSCLKDVAKIHASFPKRFNMTFTAPENGIITEEFIRKTANTGAHIVGGCPVGDVLTNDLKVKGTSGLRVVDASSLRAMPTSSGPLTSVFMLAFYMSDQIICEGKMTWW